MSSNSNMADQSFTVTLPSNSNMQMHPANRGNDYTVRLATPLNFAGQTLNDSVCWEAALASIQYTNRFYDVRDATVVYIVVVYPTADYIVTRDTQPVPGIAVLSTIRTLATLTTFTQDEARVLKPFVKIGAGGITETTVLGFTKITIPAGVYKSISQVYMTIVSGFNTLFNTPRFSNVSMNAQINGANGTIHFRLSSDAVTLHMHMDQASMVNTLGLKAALIDTDKAPVIYKVTLKGVKTPRFDVVQALYVYSDIVKDQHVGDTLAPLMEVVPVQGSPGQRVQYNLSPLSYLPVKRTFIETIKIYICDEYGNSVTFPDDTETVVCRLRFRRAKHDILSLI